MDKQISLSRTSVQEKPQKRSASVGAVPREKKHFTSRQESSGGISLDVRCACQYYESDSLLPERVNPIGSRPESNIGYVADIPDLSRQDVPFSNQSKKQFDQISTRSFPLQRHNEHLHSDKMLVKSSGAQRSFGSQFSIHKSQRALDEYEGRDLVVGTIADINDPTQIIRPVLSNRNQREMSSDRFSNKNFPIQDPDTISNRSFVRRLSRSPSKQNLYVADIIVPTQIATHSRRNSRIELPQFNIIAPTPITDGKIDFSVLEEFHKNKLELERNKENIPATQSRFDNLTKNLNDVEPVEVIEQQKNVSSSKEPVLFEIPTMSIQMETIITENILAPSNAGTNIEIVQEISKKSENKETGFTSPKPYSYSTSELDIQDCSQSSSFNTHIEQLSPKMNNRKTSTFYNIGTEQTVSLRDKSLARKPMKEELSLIPISSTLPPQNRPLSLENIEIVGDVAWDKKSNPTVIIQPPKKEHLKIESLKIQLPKKETPKIEPTKIEPSKIEIASNRSKNTNLGQKIQQELVQPIQLKRHHTPEVDSGLPDIKQKAVEQDANMEKPLEKPSKFSFFGSKNKNSANNNEKVKEKSPPREKSPARFFGQRRKSRPELVMVSSADQLMTVGGPQKISRNNTPSPVAPSTTVQETFSLKVDELDQYAPRPKSVQSGMSNVSIPQKAIMSSLNESQSFDNSDHKSRESSFCPVVIPNSSQQKLFGSRKTISTSHPEIHSQMEGNFREQAFTEQFRGGVDGQQLITMPVGIPLNFEEQQAPTNTEPDSTIDITESYKSDDNRSYISNQETLITRIVKTPSEQRIKQSSLLRRKKNFERTQSQDRANLLKNSESSEDKLSKTVSFDFGYESREIDYEKLRGQKPRDDKQSWLEKTYFSRDHEYEPIGQPDNASSTTAIDKQTVPNLRISQPMEVDAEIEAKSDIQKAEDFQKNLEDTYFQSGEASELDLNDIDESQIDPKALKKSFMANAQDKSRKIQAGIRNQAGIMKTKLRGMRKPASKTSGSPTKVKERKKFKTLEFSKMKMPKFSKPDISRFKAPELKRPEFTKFNMPEMPKFKLPEKLTSMKLKRSKSLKEEPDTSIATGESETIPEAAGSNDTPAKKKFEFNFGTYPRALRRKKIKDSVEEIRRVHEQKTIPKTETQTFSVQRGARDKGPVGSKWADKFSDVSYGDSESGRFQRYGSEVESFERESSMERRMKEDLAAQEEAELAMIDTIERKQFAEFDEENRAIHEISKIREDEFKQRRPMIHQDSNLSEESKDLGWNEKDALRNKMLRRAESEGYGNNYASEEGLTGSANTNHETQSTTSSSAKKGVIEEIDDDEFFLRKRGISQDNIEFRQYISEAIREGFDNPVNALAQLGSSQGEYPDSMLGLSQEQMNFEFDAQPPMKPKRSKRRVERHLDSQEFNAEQKENYDDNVSLPQTGSDYFVSSLPSRPLRKSRKVFAQDSQSDIQNMPYFDDIEKDFYHKDINLDDSNLMTSYVDDEIEEINNQRKLHPPKPPKRKKSGRENEETDSFINGFGGRSISNSYLQNDIQPEELIVYRAQPNYNIPLAQPESLNSTPAPTIHRSCSHTNNEDDDRTSRGADSFVSNGLVMEHHQNYKIEINNNNGYATVKKEPPSQPPAPVRRRKRTNGRFATMPVSMTPPPERPRRNYSTIGPPRPPKRKTSFESNEFKRNNSSPDLTQYEELDPEINMGTRIDSPKHLQSGEIVNKMKFRPLPPPPRPQREKKKSKRPNNFNNKDDRDGGGEKLRYHEVDVSIQTDPLPDDFVCEEFEITDDMKVIEPRISRTLDEALLDDPEMEKQKWSNEEHLSKGIQRFRESNQRSISEKSRASSQADRSKSSRPQTPNAILIEKRVPTPVPHTYETALEASLTVQPIDDLDDEILSSFHDGSYEESSGNQASTVKSVGSHTDEELERLKEFEAEEKKLKEEEEQRQRDNEEELIIMEKIREFRAEEQREKEELERKLRESDDQHIMEKILELERQEEEDRKIMEKILELQRQEEEDKNIMDKIRQLEDECAIAGEFESNLESSPTSPDHENHKTEETLSNIQGLSDVESSSNLQQQAEIFDPELIPPPTPPPRRRSAGPPNQQEEPVNQVVLSDPISSTVPIETPSVNLPSRLIDLEVERLRVHALQASHIMVNQLHGAKVGADELECKSGNLVVKNFELPPGFIEDIVERVRSSERGHAQVETQTSEQNDLPTSYPERLIQPPDQAPTRPPLPQQPFPSEYMHTIPPASFYQLRNPMTYEDPEDYQPNFHTSRRRRHHRRHDSSSGDSHRRSRSTKSPETSVVRLGGQFLQACGTSIVRQMNNVASYIRTQEKEKNERSVGYVVAIFILMILGFLLMGMSGKNIHHHHWDFFNPPDNNGRSQT